MTSLIRRALARVWSSLRVTRAESELAREITAHLQLLEDEFVAQGMSRDEARYAARRAFGGVEQAKEHQRDTRSFRWLTGWPMDLKLGFRMLLKSPGLTIVAVAGLAVAIGAGAAYLEFTRDMMQPRLRIADGARVVGIKVWHVERGAAETRALHDFAVWRAHASGFEHLGAHRGIDRPLLAGDGRAEPARAVEISASAFDIVPTPPLFGRALEAADERPEAPPVMVIGHEVWRRRFNEDPLVVGKTARLGATTYTIVGVMPDGFAFPAYQNLWIPLKVPAAGVERGQGRSIYMFGRLRANVNASIAQAELQSLMTASASPGTTLRADVRPYLDSLLMEDRNGSEARILYAANVGFILLLAICAANVATLVFARTATREAEITVRTALGASRGRVAAQLFAEALVLSSVAAFVGLAVASAIGEWGAGLLVEAAGRPRPFWWDPRLSAETYLYAALLAVLAALVVGVLPALKATGPQLQGRLREAAGPNSTMKFGWLWTGVIVTQAAITVMFLATVVTLARTTIISQGAGYVTYPREQLLTARLEPESHGRSAPRLTPETLTSLVTSLRKEPGVVTASYTSSLPGTLFEQVRVEFDSTPQEELWCQGSAVGLNFFDAVGVPLVAGRYFTDAEIRGGQQVAIVDETFVRLMLGGRNAVGLAVRLPGRAAGGTTAAWHEIVGVVKDVTVFARKERSDGVLYRPAGTMAEARLLVRTQGLAAPMADRIVLAALAAQDDVRLDQVRSMERVAEEEAMPFRVFLRVFGVVSAVAMLLATAGIYALISFTLARRTREIGIRMALGAAPHRIISGIFSRAFAQVGVGVLLGASPGTMIVLMGGGLRLVTAAGITLGIAAFVIAIVTLACTTPLRRALRIEPTQALRADA